MDYLNDIDEATPALYSRILILIYSLCLTPLGGVILMSINMVRIGRLVNIIWLVIALILFETGHLAVLMYYGPSTVTFFLPLVLWSILFAFPVWNILLKGIKTYRKRGVLVPIIVLLLIWVPLLVINFFNLGN
jgi:hypothetical protein